MQARARRRWRLCVSTSAVGLAASGLAGVFSAALAQQDEEPASPPPLLGVESAALGLQESAPAPAEDRGVEVFEPDFFSLYNPVTARDMVGRVPGFSIAGGGGGRRGFATNDANVLINGERPSSKTSINDQLGRIAAENVDHIELLRGAALADADVRGQTQVVNVVLLPGASVDPVTTYSGELSTNRTERPGFTLQATRALRVRDADVTLDIRAQQRPESGAQTETVTASDGTTTEIRDEGDTRENAEIRLNAAASWAPTLRDAFNVSVDFTPETSEQDNYSIITDGDGAPVRSEFTSSEERDSYEFELGGDWEHQLSRSTSFKILGLVTERTGANETREDGFLPSGYDSSSLVLSDSTTGERILRGSFTWRANDAHTVEAGLEGAFNYRDSMLDLQVADALDGPFVSIFADDVRVEELRAEAYVSDVWSVAPRLSVESGFTFEASRISQIRDEGAPYEREFTYPKPNVTATYSLQSGDQFRLSVTRDVAQLNFGDFASSVSLGDDREEAGNQELEPEKTWETRLQWERRFATRGVVTIELYHDAVEDKQDRVPIPVRTFPDVEIDLDDPSTYRLVDGAGNLGEGTRIGLSADTTLPLDDVGLPNAELRMRGRVQDSEVEDPVTGAMRPFSGNNDWDYHIDFRQDVPEHGFAWGASYGKDALRKVYRVTEEQEFGPADGFLDVYAETTRFMGVTIRAQVGNLADSAFLRRRYFYLDPVTGDARARDLGPPDAVEVRERNMGRFYSLRVSGTF